MPIGCHSLNIFHNTRVSMGKVVGKKCSKVFQHSILRHHAIEIHCVDQLWQHAADKPMIIDTWAQWIDDFSTPLGQKKNHISKDWSIQ